MVVLVVLVEARMRMSQCSFPICAEDPAVRESPAVVAVWRTAPGCYVYISKTSYQISNMTLSCSMHACMEQECDGWSVTNRVCNSINPCIPPLSSLLSDGVVIRNTRVGAGVAVRVEKRVIRSVVFGSWRREGVRIRNGWVGGRWCGFVGGEGGWVRRARSWVWRLVSEFFVRGWVGLGRGFEGRGWGERVPWSLGLVEDVRRGVRVERDGRRRRVVQNMAG